MCTKGGTHIVWIRFVHHAIFYMKVNTSSMSVELTRFSERLRKDVHAVGEYRSVVWECSEGVWCGSIVRVCEYGEGV